MKKGKNKKVIKSQAKSRKKKVLLKEARLRGIFMKIKLFNMQMQHFSNLIQQYGSKELHNREKESKMEM